MEHQAFLATISEVAVAFAGFTGVVAAFRFNSGQWSMQEKGLFSTMLRAAISALFMSLVPYLMHQYLANADLAWRASAALIALIMAINIFASHRRRVLRSSRLSLLLFPVAILVVSMNLLAVAGMLPADKVVLTSLVWQLLISTHNFMLLIMSGTVTKVVEENVPPEMDS